MARTRLLKPEFFRSEDVGTLEPMARLLFAGLWTLADREGRLFDRPRRIAADLFPYDEDPKVDLHLGALAARGLIVRYVADGKNCLEITGFKKHQAPHFKEPAGEVPAPPDNHSVGQSPGITGPVQCQFPSSGSDPDPVSDPVSLAPPRGRRKGYPDAFEALWKAVSVIGGLGNSIKGEAAADWENVGKPSAELVAPRWREYLASIKPDLSPKHFGRWLKKRGHEQTYTPFARGSPQTRTDEQRRANALQPPPADWRSHTP